MTPTLPTESELARRKKAIRASAHSARKAQTNKNEISKRITDSVCALPAYQKANSVLWYIDVRDEVRTQHNLPAVLASNKKIVIPFCVGNDLQLFHLESLDELTPGKYGILEPDHSLRNVITKQVSITEVDMVIVPGVAFDPHGGRLGHGKGYYDKLLQQASESTTLAALAFQCQIVTDIPMQSHDIAMDWVVTENKTYPDIHSSEHPAIRTTAPDELT
ncbi:5-formyltetrahydrofolate cyclo-ligase [Neorhodopirellula lusitana]|uniref:5-formyltetrahydrofolate cyclo-ligase n=1 Tax=Neorhodopirellula lusitana TaxID=445327 RepID=A0ABY1QBX8_9BACT|nr:5-formyltetrahydrofolate cyclo-ligase [Neorhodopirellula lusitana]SMP66020.1 5-formyltetrahydrofolate cyclo-ligase [Neorhodopirellula lusitana]